MDNESINVVESDLGGNCKRVHFADLISVRPVPATGKGKPTPPRSRDTISTVWQSTDVLIDDVGDEREPDVLAWVDDREGRPADSHSEEVGCVHARQI